MITQNPEALEVGLADEGTVEAKTAPPSTWRRLPWRLIIGAIVVAALVIWGIARLIQSGQNTPRYISAPVTRADIDATVEETGTVNPVDEVDVGTQVSGTITSLSVDFNSIVHKGQVLATLDQTPFQAAALQAQGAVAAAQSNAAAAQSTASQSAAAIQSARASALQAVAGERTASANVAKAAAQVELSDATVARDRSLLAQGFIAQSQMDADRASARANQADLQAAQAALSSAKAQASAASTQIASASFQHEANINQAAAASAQVEAGQGQARQAQYNLERAAITSPIDGIVVSRGVSVGQTVAASFQTPTLFVIASSLRDMQVDTSVSEADVGQLRTGAPARITVPAFPNTTFAGTVTQVRVNPTTVQNVVTYDAIVAVHDDSARLKPGMTADVVISVTTRRHVLAIPASALLFHPIGGARGGTQNGQPGQSQNQSSGGQPAQSQATQGQGAQAQGGTNQVAGAPGSHAAVYVIRDGKAVRVPIVIGVNDGRNYEVSRGDLHVGDRVIVSQLQTNEYTNSNPMAGGPGFGR